MQLVHVDSGGKLVGGIELDNGEATVEELSQIREISSHTLTTLETLSRWHPVGGLFGHNLPTTRESMYKTTPKHLMGAPDHVWVGRPRWVALGCCRAPSSPCRHGCWNINSRGSRSTRNGRWWICALLPEALLLPISMHCTHKNVKISTII